MSGIFSRFREIAGRSPKAPAIFYKASGAYKSMNYSALIETSLKAGNFIASCGVKKGAKMAILLGNQKEWPVFFLAAAYTGAVSVPLDVKADPLAVKEQLVFSGAVAVICSEKTLARFGDVLNSVKGLKVIVADNKEFLSLMDKSARETSDYDKEVKDDDTAAIFFTSGTASSPKAVQLTHRNLLANAESIMKFGKLSTRDCFISILPLHHTYSVTTTCVLPLALGGRISYPQMLSSKDILDCIKKTRVTVLVGVPQVFFLFHKEISEKLYALKDWQKKATSRVIDVLWSIRQGTGINLAKLFLSKLHRTFGRSLVFMISGGAKLDPEVETCFYKWGFTLFQGYGLTETAPIITLNTPFNHRIGSVGQPVPGVEIMIMEPDKDGLGELAVKGPNVMPGYFKDEARTKKAFKDEYFKTGDLAKIDKDGFVFIEGRKDDMIILTSGENINPANIEEYYARSSYVDEICVFSAKEMGFLEQAEQLAAVVYPKEEYRTKDKLDCLIRDDFSELGAGLRDFCRIKQIIIAKEPLSKTSLGKTIRGQVKEQYCGKGVCERRTNTCAELSISDKELMAMPVCKEVLAYFSERFKKEVNLNDHLEFDLGIDSLGKIELLMGLQEKFHIQIPEEDLETFFYSNTVKELFTRALPLMKDIKKTV